jgi:CheY-like chemotaxis protein
MSEHPLEQEMVVARILIVDDDPQIRRQLRMLLEAKEHEVLDAPDGRAGLRLADHVRVDALFCDIFMADQYGLETFRGNFPGVPVVAMSGGGFGGMLDMLPTASRMATGGDVDGSASL